MTIKMKSLRKSFAIKLTKKKISVAFVVMAVIAMLSVRSFSAIVSADSDKGVFVPIIMYHSILKDESRWNDYVLSPVEFEKDLVYLREHGYTTVFISELISYVYEGTPLPEKPVVITLDDGFYNNLVYALPILERLEMKAVVSVTGEFCDLAVKENDPNPAYAYVTWEDIKLLTESGHIEIGNHTYDLHDTTDKVGAKRREWQTYEEYRDYLISDTMKLNKELNNIGIIPSVYTFPYGLYSEESTKILKACGFLASMITTQKPNYITDENSLFNMNRYNRPSFISTEEFMKKALSH